MDREKILNARIKKIEAARKRLELDRKEFETEKKKSANSSKFSSEQLKILTFLDEAGISTIKGFNQFLDVTNKKEEKEEKEEKPNNQEEQDMDEEKLANILKANNEQMMKNFQNLLQPLQMETQKNNVKKVFEEALKGKKNIPFLKEYYKNSQEEVIQYLQQSANDEGEDFDLDEFIKANEQGLRANFKKYGGDVDARLKSIESDEKEVKPDTEDDLTLGNDKKDETKNSNDETSAKGGKNALQNKLNKLMDEGKDDEAHQLSVNAAVKMTEDQEQKREELGLAP